MQLTVRETPLAKLAEGLIGESWRVSPDQRSVAYVEERSKKILFKEIGKKYRVVRDATATKDYDHVGITGGLVFSPDGKRLAYPVAEGKHWRTVIDGNESAPCDGVVNAPIVFSPDSARYAYGIKQGGRFHLIVDGAPSPAYANIGSGSVAFSADSSRVAWAACNDDRTWSVVVDGSAGKAWAATAAISFAPLGGWIAHGAIEPDGRKRVVMLGGEEGPLYDDIAFLDAFGWSPRGDAFAYAAGAPDGSWRMVLNGEEQGTFASVAERFFQWSASGRLAYDVQAPDGWCAVVDGQRQKAYPDLGKGHFVWSADGSRYAYVAAAPRGGLCVVLDGVEQPVYDGIGHESLRFSPDGRRFGYCANVGGKWTTIVDGNHGLSHEFIELVAWQFSPDGRHYAYVAERNGKDFFVVDGVESDARFDAFVSDIVFDAPDRFHALAKRGDLVITADVEISE